MGKYLSILIGAGLLVAGIILFILWMPELVVMIKGSVPAILAFAGIISVIAGFSELKDTKKMNEPRI